MMCFMTYKACRLMYCKKTKKNMLSVLQECNFHKFVT